MAIQAGQPILASDFVNSSAGAADAGKGVKLGADGKIDSSMYSLASADTQIPKPEVSTSGVLAGVQLNSNTTASVGLINIPQAISCNTISIRKTALGTAGNFKFALFSVTGQTKLFEETIATGAGTGMIVYPLTTRREIPAGKYYAMLVPVGTTDFSTYMYTTQTAGTLGTDSLYSDGGTLFPYEGILTVTAGTIPTTFSPSSITAAANRTPAFRLDNATSYVITFTATSTWTCPAGVTSAVVECWGGGGSGARTVTGGQGGGGGGGGAYSRSTLTVVPTTVYTVTVGTGGASVGTSSVDGNPGNDSWFSTSGTILAKGGLGGKRTTTAAGGQASSGVGDTKYSGGTGAWGAGAGHGGGSSAGTASNGNNASGGTGGAAPTGGGKGGDGDGGGGAQGGFTPGGGGGGSWNGTAAAGADGRVKITYTPA